MTPLSNFSRRVIKIILSIPHGKVATYQQVAELAGNGNASRGVSWILHSCSTKYRLPWHRVINSRGQISFKKRSFNFKKQKRLLLDEGVFVDISGRVELSNYKWKKEARQPRSGPKIFAKKGFNKN